METFILLGSQIKKEVRGGTGGNNEGIQGIYAEMQTKDSSWKT